MYRLMNRKFPHCLHCQKPLDGRADKKYCDRYCKSAHQYQRDKERPERFYTIVDNHLRMNRKILKQCNKAGKVTVRTKILLDLGFNPNFFTHYWKTKKGDVYLFVYEYGFLKKKESGNEKYVLVLWQDYMNKSFRK